MNVHNNLFVKYDCNTFVSSIWGADHDFTLEEVLTEIAYFRGESYHTIRECGEPNDGVALDDGEEEIFCIRTNFSSYAKLIRSGCKSLCNFLLLVGHKKKVKLFRFPHDRRHN